MTTEEGPRRESCLHGAGCFYSKSRGVIQAGAAVARHDSEDARILLKVIDGMEGTRSDCIEEMRFRLQAALPPAA
jgi:hypothetical protein